MAKLILFTSSFPYGDKETYLEKELEILSKEFAKIEIYPHFYKDQKTEKRIVPSNVKVHTPAYPLNKSGRLYLAFKGLFKRPKMSRFIKEFFQFKIYKSIENFKRWSVSLFDYLATIGTSQFNVLKKEDNVVFYFYWGIGWAYSCLNFEKKVNRKIFLRLHGGDAYLVRSNGYLPVRKLLFDKADYLLPISDNLKKYLNDTFLIAYDKMIVSRLGVDIPKIEKRKKTINPIRIVSCSNVIAL